ncbi:unnamed protein product [Spirodela intermedia]|uniref:Uncharacterized protein n=1 Tax=Spirodela intermedia TaxID=51605 RepID=A0A7I8IX28_SPIIN|nr:unnamed protein product [Spirodela intermedia]CAA6661540.1 unnamed protein product [Spirodela intermedia]
MVSSLTSTCSFIIIILYNTVGMLTTTSEVGDHKMWGTPSNPNYYIDRASKHIFFVEHSLNMQHLQSLCSFIPFNSSYAPHTRNKLFTSIIPNIDS